MFTLRHTNHRTELKLFSKMWISDSNSACPIRSGLLRIKSILPEKSALYIGEAFLINILVFVQKTLMKLFSRKKILEKIANPVF